MNGTMLAHVLAAVVLGSISLLNGRKLLAAGQPGVGRKAAVHVTASGLFFYGLMVLALLAGDVTAVLFPDSWLGAQIGTFFGCLGFMATVVLVAVVAEVGLARAGVQLRRAVPDPS
jgi:hypothetical protein